MSSYRFDLQHEISNASISNSKGARINQKGKRNTKTPAKHKNSIEAKLKASTEIGDNWLELVLPILTVSEANGGVKKSYQWKGKTKYKGEHWTEKNERHKRQKGAIILFLRPHRHIVKLPCIVTLTRYAPKKLGKFDNLPMAFKWILDAICEVITGDYRAGLADDIIEDDIDVIYKQEICQEYGIKVQIQNCQLVNSLSS